MSYTVTPLPSPPGSTIRRAFRITFVNDGVLSTNLPFPFDEINLFFDGTSRFTILGPYTGFSLASGIQIVASRQARSAVPTITTFALGGPDTFATYVDVDPTLFLTPADWLTLEFTLCPASEFPPIAVL